jgi:hypothetical protein
MRIALLPLALLAASPTPALAELIPLTFEATINTVAPELESAFTVGETVTGSFVVDTTASDLEPGPDEGDYAEAISELEADFGGYAVTGLDVGLYVRNGETPMVDNFFVSGDVSGSDVGGLSGPTFFLDLGDTENTVFSSAAIPTELDLADFEVANVSLSFPDGGFNRSVVANVTELVYEVPEPAAPLLALVGALALALRSRAQTAR